MSNLIGSSSASFQLYHGDCLELLKHIPDKSIDMVLCDLPYGVTRNEWDKKLDLQLLWQQYRRITRPGAVVALFAKQRFTIEVGASNLKHFRYKLVWLKQRGTDFLNANRKPLAAHEDVLIFYDRQPVYNKIMRTGFTPYGRVRSGKPSKNLGEFRTKWESINEDGSRFPLDCLEYPYVQNKVHSTAKPIELLQWLIKTYTNDDAVVLDNCMGSGSTGIAAANTGRKFIGMELDQGFYEIASQRIAAAYSQVTE